MVESLSERARACRALARREALKAAGVSALPVLGADLVVNGHLLVKTLSRINEAYGLSPALIAVLPPAQRTQVDELKRKLGTYLIGRAITQGALIAALRAIGVRLGAQQAAKLAPLVGQVASGALSGYAVMSAAAYRWSTARADSIGKLMSYVAADPARVDTAAESTSLQLALWNLVYFSAVALDVLNFSLVSLWFPAAGLSFFVLLALGWAGAPLYLASLMVNDGLLWLLDPNRILLPLEWQLARWITPIIAYTVFALPLRGRVTRLR